MATALLLRITVLGALGKAVGRWLIGALVVGAVFFGPNGVDPHDIVHHLRGSALVALVVAALAAAWIAPSVRAALVAPGTDLVRALPYHPGVLGGALFLGVLVAAAPFAVLVVAGGGPGIAFAFALVAVIAAVQPRARDASRVRTWLRASARLGFAASSVVVSFRAPIPTALVAGPFGAWALAGAFRDARADRGAPLRLVGGPAPLAVPWSVVVEGSRSDVGAVLRALVLVASAALLARMARPRFDSPVLPTIVAALAAATLAMPGLVLAWARSARAHRALPLAFAPESLVRRAALGCVVVPFWAFLLATGSFVAAVGASAVLALFAVALASGGVVAGERRAEERLPLVAAALVAVAGGCVVISPWAAVGVLALVAAGRPWIPWRSS